MLEGSDTSIAEALAVFTQYAEGPNLTDNDLQAHAACPTHSPPYPTASTSLTNTRPPFGLGKPISTIPGSTAAQSSNSFVAKECARVCVSAGLLRREASVSAKVAPPPQ